MLTKYTVFQPNGVSFEDEADLPEQPSFREIFKIVGPIIGDGEPIERVRILYGLDYTDMFVSELGHLTLSTRMPLPINPMATDLYRENMVANEPDIDPDLLPVIAGVAVVFHRPVWF